MPHLIELWEMLGSQRMSFTPACLNCGWTGKGGSRIQAEAEGLMHEQDEAPSRQDGSTESQGAISTRTD